MACDLALSLADEISPAVAIAGPTALEMQNHKSCRLIPTVLDEMLAELISC